MEAALQQFLEAGLAPSTRKVYTAGWNRYLKFAHNFSLACLPVTSEKATLFVAFLGTQGLSLSTIESYIRLTLAPCDPCPSLHSPQMALLLRGIRRSQAQSGPRLVRLPIMPTLMRRIKSTLARHADSYDSIPLFCLENGQPLQRRSFTTQVQQALSASGVDGSLFNAHSFCLGAATSASIAGVSESIIKRL